MSNLEELEVKNVCSLSCDAPTNMCSLLGDHTCGDGGKTIQGKYLEILEFRHFQRHMSFSQNDRKTYKKAISDGIDVSVVLDMECGNIQKSKGLI